MSFQITNGSLDGYSNSMFCYFVDKAFELSGNPHLKLSSPRDSSKTPSENYEIWAIQIAEALKTTDASKIQDYIFIKLLNRRGIHYKKCSEAASFYRSLIPAFEEMEGDAVRFFRSLSPAFEEMAENAVGYYSNQCHDMIQALEKCSIQKRHFRIIE